MGRVDHASLEYIWSIQPLNIPLLEYKPLRIILENLVYIRLSIVTVNSRLGLLEPPHPKQKDTSSRQPAPLFLLFLDCVWQLQLQFPIEFQFTETYLTTLWDCCHNQIFDTFLFNCPRDRELAVTNVCYPSK